MQLPLSATLLLAWPRAAQGRQSGPAACKVAEWERREIKGCSKLFLHYAKLGDDGAKELALALQGSAVTSISLFGCGIGDRGAAALAAAMEQTDAPLKLEILDLGGNNIGDAGAAALGHALQVFAGLTELNLADNKEITDVGAKAIAQSLDPGYTECELRTLNLWGVNKIGQMGVEALVKAAEMHPSLVTVVLQPAESADPAMVKRLQMACGMNKKSQHYGLKPGGTKKGTMQQATMKTNLLKMKNREL